MVMNRICQELGFGNLAEHFDGEQPEEWVVVNSENIRVLKNNHMVADIHIEQKDNAKQYTVIVQEVEDLIRLDHAAEFNPETYGILPPEPPDWKGERPPRLEIEYTLPDDENVLQGPRQIRPRQMQMKAVKVANPKKMM